MVLLFYFCKNVLDRLHLQAKEINVSFQNCTMQPIIYFSKDYVSYFYSFYFSSNWSSLCNRNVERRRNVCKRSPVIMHWWNGVIHWLWKLQTFQNHHNEYEHLTFCKGFSRTAPFSNTEGNEMANALKICGKIGNI